MAATSWEDSVKSLKGVILDMCGVLYDAGEDGGTPIPGSVEAVKRLKASDLQVRFCTNETQATREVFVAKLQRMGFDICVSEVFSPAPAAVAVLKERGLRPHLLVYDGVVPEFDSVEKANPNCVVIGDAAEKFSYQNLNDAFRVLIGLEKPVLFSLGRGKYYKEDEGLNLDVGVYMKALETLMIGDDLVNDVGGAQHCGMKGVQVRTGKYRPNDEKHPTVTADGYVDNLAEAVETILKLRGQ
uniref:phospholysine phosphohistidine inorganic pyrophosphate phosphatase-like isoform X2 n=2 Tax=Oncorhynchus gorbuscha TaxID=8017 RepID=UPI001EAF5AB6|nr:phospholysine phosphohistidine inorganic pyrophosphate phosphatase-like isoform X2 [Oncorhynchus gorbuscha]